MLKLKIQKISQDYALINLEVLTRLIDSVKELKDIELEEVADDLPCNGLMQLSETSGALNFLNHETENIYSANDLKVRYQ